MMIRIVFPFFLSVSMLASACERSTFELIEVEDSGEQDSGESDDGDACWESCLEECGEDETCWEECMAECEDD